MGGVDPAGRLEERQPADEIPSLGNAWKRGFPGNGGLRATPGEALRRWRYLLTSENETNAVVAKTP